MLPMQERNCIGGISYFGKRGHIPVLKISFSSGINDLTHESSSILDVFVIRLNFNPGVTLPDTLQHCGSIHLLRSDSSRGKVPFFS